MSAPLALACYRVTLEAVEPLDLPAYLGSTLRGAFGRAFRRLCCLGRDGEACPLPQSCPYHLVFETAPPPDADALRTHDEIPRPFVIAPPPAGPAEHPAGSEVCFDLTLVRPREATVTLEDCAAVACPGGPVRVSFVTQTRLKHDGAFARRPEFQVLFRRLLGRLSALARFHGDRPLDVDFRGLIDAAGHVKLVSDETRPTRWARYSARQDRRMQWEGLEGSVVYEGDLAPFWPYLVFGQWTHVGSGATFGLGGYRIEP